LDERAPAFFSMPALLGDAAFHSLIFHGGGVGEPGQADWTERMGHAVLVFQNQIWVMGGRDSAGNALNDIWKRDASSPKWTPRDRSHFQNTVTGLLHLS
jgi:hypothetical protein